MPATKYQIVPPYYPIVYVRGYAMTEGEREDVFHDAYYGFAATSVEMRDAPPPKYYQVDIFEGQFVRFLKMGDYSYADEMNRGLETFHDNPSRSIWISRFYDEDYHGKKPRDIGEHAKDLHELVCKTIPERLESCGVDLGRGRRDYKVILLAHSMGGLVCRTLIQNILPGAKQDPTRWIHRLVTIGTPHGGIDLGAVPDSIERGIAAVFNPYNSAIFSEKKMREYLKLDEAYDVHSIGDQFPVKRCLCIVGSDHGSYGAVRHLTGEFSDGLVKQDRAYIVGGKRPAVTNKDDKVEYPEHQRAFWANVHRAHSGRRGIVNSYETFENIHRFLFGDTLAEIRLEDMRFPASERGVRAIYDIEVLISVRGTGVYLHRREQDPCENAIRLDSDAGLPKALHLHTGFLNSALRPEAGEPYSHFALELRVVQRLVKKETFWDREYPARPIYKEAVEIRVGDIDPDNDGAEVVQYRWLSDTVEWQTAPINGEAIKIPLRAAGSFSGTLAVTAKRWPEE